LRLLRWYETGADLRVKLPLLATYLGHIGLTSSQVYLHLTEDFASELTRRQIERFGEVITEMAR
jgi:integrase/recombinase XerD